MNALPRDDDAESIVLESVLFTPGALETVRRFLPADGFDNPDRRKIYAAAIAVQDTGKDADAAAILAHMRDRGEPFDRIRNTIRSLQDNGMMCVTWEQSARRLADLWRVREVAKIGQAFWAKATTTKLGDPVAFVTEARSALSSVLDQREARDDASSMKAGVHEVFETMVAAGRAGGGGLLGPSTGIPKLDELLFGMQRKKLIVVAGRPGHGKTALGNCLVVSGCDTQDRKVGAFVASAEMDRTEFILRTCASEARVDARRAMVGQLSPAEWSRMTQAATFLSDLPIFVDGTSPVTIFDIKGRVRRHVDQCAARDEDVSIVMIDYLQRIASGHVKGRNREGDVAEVAKEAKQLAKDTDTCVIALAQAGRAVDKSNGPPTLADLRESGNIEAEADVVIFIHHPNGYKTPGRAELHVAKHRGGPCGTVHVEWDPFHTRFGPWEGPEPEPEEAKPMNGGRKW